MSKDKDLREKALQDAKNQLREEADRKELLKKTVQYLEEVNQDFSQKAERFTDWYSLYFPEVTGKVTDNEELIKLLEDGVKRNKVKGFKKEAEDSKGFKFKEEDIEALQKAYDDLSTNLETKNHLRNYIENIARAEAPNLSKLLTPVLAGKLIYLAGGLKELSQKPSSTVQMLGAEKALFRHLHGKGKPPKHGVIYEHEFLRKLPEEKRGKMARKIANQAVIAARLDQYGDKDKGEKLRKELAEEFQNLKD